MLAILPAAALLERVNRKLEWHRGRLADLSSRLPAMDAATAAEATAALAQHAAAIATLQDLLAPFTAPEPPG